VREQTVAKKVKKEGHRECKGREGIGLKRETSKDGVEETTNKLKLEIGGSICKGRIGKEVFRGVIIPPCHLKV
jgi:hypothetical protein